MAKRRKGLTHDTFIIPTMFAKAAQDVLSPEDAARAAEKEIQRIFDKWK